MPWRGMDAEKAETGFPFPSLGVVAWQWIEEHCVIPDGPFMGEPYRLTNEMVRFLINYYRVNPDSWSDKFDGPKFHYERGGQLVRSQKWGKGPLLSAVICFEAIGPAVPAGWDAEGRIVGRPWDTPLIPVTAVSEMQTANVFRALLPMIWHGPLADRIPDAGETRINLPGGGRIWPTTASARSALGGRLTFVPQDEALAVDTPIPTPTGWTTMGAIKVGDQLIGADGLPCTVMKATDVQHGRDCYRVSFADETSIVASDGHLWATKLACSATLPKVRTTGEMFHDPRRFRIPISAPFKLPDIDLPVDPYLLGLWLADGSKGQCHFTEGVDDAAAMCELLAQRGIETWNRVESRNRPTVRRVSFSNIKGRGRPEVAKAFMHLPCYRDKHIPPEYFRASYDQRLDLLRGLMDGDGHVTATGHITYAGNRRLCADVVTLLRTFGEVVHVVWHDDPRATEGGGCKVNFMPRHDFAPFALKRKVERLRRTIHANRHWLSITNIEPVPSVPVRCIEVDTADHLFLAGEGCHVTHNTHSWLERNGGIRLADTQRRNVAGMGGRFLETTNAWDISEQSVAQLTFENPVGVYVDYPQPIGGSIRNKAERRKAMRHAYGDSVRNGPTWKAWVDLDRIDVEVEALMQRDPAQAERFFLNRTHEGEAVAFDLEAWTKAAKPEHVVADRSLITIGVDGALTEDDLAIVACDVAGFHLWPLHVQSVPPNPPIGYEHDLELADEAMQAAFDRWNPWRVYIDPQRIEKLVAIWQGRWGQDRIIEWRTNFKGQRAVGSAVRSFITEVAGGHVSHDGDSLFSRHIFNARRRPMNMLDDNDQRLFTLGKDRPHSPNKIDAAFAAVLAAEARRDAIAAGVLNRRRATFGGF